MLHFSLQRRLFLWATGYASLLHRAFALPARTLVFPRDHGAHPDFQSEWWYLTGSAMAGTRRLGFQVTFFRKRVEATQGMTSRFAAKQLIVAHAAVTDVQGKKLWHDQRIDRAGFGISQADASDTAIVLGDWRLARQSANGSYRAQIHARDFALDLQFTPSQGVLLQGHNGLSRKGPDEKQASYYYSQPQLQTTGSIRVQGQQLQLQDGTAWLDHEWSQELLHPDAVGWDWIGINLFDGASLMAFQLRQKDGSALWTGGTYRAAARSAQPHIASPGEVQFQAVRGWKSPLTGATYPVQWLVRTPADYYTVKALLDNQESDSRASTGIVYWEGLCELSNSNGSVVGRGYLEMTGYAGALKV